MPTIHYDTTRMYNHRVDSQWFDPFVNEMKRVLVPKKTSLHTTKSKKKRTKKNLRVCNSRNIENNIDKAIANAKYLNRPFSFKFNGMKITVNKRMSYNHVLNQYKTRLNAKLEKYKRGLIPVKYTLEHSDVKYYSDCIHKLMKNQPNSKFITIQWIYNILFHYFEYPDHLHLDTECIKQLLSNLGFIAGQHRNSDDIKNDTATLEEKIEFVGGTFLLDLKKDSINYTTRDWARNLSRLIKS